jgi:K+-sensing histidine kinase KdpD
LLLGARSCVVAADPDVPPLVLGIVVGVVLIAAQALVAYPERRVGAPEVSLGVVYMPGVPVVSTVWGLSLGAANAVLGIAAFDLFHVQPACSSFAPIPQGPVAFVTCLSAALLLGLVAIASGW